MLDLASQAAQALSDLAWLTLLHSAWIGLLLGSIAAAAGAILPPGAHRTRHAIALTALLLIAIGSPSRRSPIGR